MCIRDSTIGIETRVIQYWILRSVTEGNKPILHTYMLELMFCMGKNWENLSWQHQRENWNKKYWTALLPSSKSSSSSCNNCQYLGELGKAHWRRSCESALEYTFYDSLKVAQLMVIPLTNMPLSVYYGSLFTHRCDFIIFSQRKLHLNKIPVSWC